MEDGLRFALHRLLDLKQIQFEYLKNPYYPAFKNDKIGEFCQQEPSTIREQIKKLIESLIQQEDSEINTKLYYEKVGKSFEHIYSKWYSHEVLISQAQKEGSRPKVLDSVVCDRHHGYFGY